MEGVRRFTRSNFRRRGPRSTRMVGDAYDAKKRMVEKTLGGPKRKVRQVKGSSGAFAYQGLNERN